MPLPFAGQLLMFAGLQLTVQLYEGVGDVTLLLRITGSEGDELQISWGFGGLPPLVKSAEGVGLTTTR